MRAKAKAKINLTLDILDRRQDGYHNIDSVMQTVSLCDKIRIKRANDIRVFDNSGINMTDNIAYKAACEFFAFSGISGGAHIYIKKRIPVSAGLGGGSADAATVITALDRLYKTKLDNKSLAQIALKVGADVPFLLRGKTARVGGIGERVEKLPDIPPLFVLLIKEGEKQSTAKAYADFDIMGHSGKKTEAFIGALKDGESFYKLVGNDFLTVTSNKALEAEIAAQNPLCYSLSGSGPTYFALFLKRRDIKRAAKALTKTGRTVIVTKIN